MLKKFLLTVVTGFAMYVFAECGCVWQGQTYDVGETWNLPAFPCVNCTCKINATGFPAVRCKNRPCPKPKCSKPKIDPNMCCPYCEDIPNIPPTVADVEADKKNEQKAGCETPTGHYNDGDVYSSNSTGIRPTSDNQCVMCVCQNGQSLCHLKTCIVPKTCSKFINTSDDCCPQCADCLDSSGIKPNGTTWHPTIASIGQIDCITCSCYNGEIQCQKDCVPDHELPCKHPQKHDGDCCKQCPDSKTNNGKKKRRNGKDKNRKGKKKGNKRRRNRKSCKDKANKNSKRCRKRKRDRANKTQSTMAPTTTPPGVELKSLCIRKNTKYLVYKAISDDEMFIAFDDLEENTVDVYRWEISKGEETKVVSYRIPDILPAPEFRRQINNTNVVGTTSNKQYKKFKRRLKSKLKKCTLSCKPELFIKIIQRVKIRLLKFGEECKT